MHNVNKINAFMQYLGSWLQDPLLLVVRLFWGYFYAKSGAVKLGHLDALSSYFADIGIPLPALSAFLTASSHFIFGLCMIVGFCTRLTAVPLAFTMIVAYLTVHSEAVNIFNPAAFLQALPFLFLYSNLLLITFGPGRISFDYWLQKKELVLTQ